MHSGLRINCCAVLKGRPEDRIRNDPEFHTVRMIEKQKARVVFSADRPGDFLCSGFLCSPEIANSECVHELV